MPGLITHYICADVCLGRLQDKNTKKILTDRRVMYNVGAQGPDVFFYYLPCLYRKSIYRMGNTLHEKKTGAFFSTALTLLSGITDTDARRAALAYLAGYLTHYALDASTHPYIYYKSGFKRKGDRTNPLRHSVNHRTFETNIDVLMLDMVSSEKPSDKKIWQFVSSSFKEAQTTAAMLSGALREVYGMKLSDRQVYAAFRSMGAVNRLLQSNGGKRKQVMAFIEDFTIKEYVISSLIHSQTADAALDFLNLKKQPWYFPWEDTTAHDSTFTDLFEIAVEQAVHMIDSLFAFDAGMLSHAEIVAIIGNRSMSTGMDAELALEFQFSEAF